MKICDLEEFVQLPSGTIFQQIQGENSICVEPLSVKGDSLGADDFWESSLMPFWLVGDEFTFGWDNTESRWGLYDHKAKFAVYEQVDIEQLKGILDDPSKDYSKCVCMIDYYD